MLAAACAHLEPVARLAQLRAAPAGQYIRKLCAIWEAITGQLLESLPAGISGSVALLFDPLRDGPRFHRGAGTGIEPTADATSDLTRIKSRRREF